MEHWTEIRTALVLARLGTISATAKAIGVHRVTISRHIETLEAVFGTPLFLRHPRGYALTEAGRDMFEVVSRADSMLTDLVGRSRSKAAQVSGKLVITALAGVAPSIMAAIQSFSEDYPEIDVEFLADERLSKLEYGEAHVAIRSGKKPDNPDYVVLSHRPLRFGLYASQHYIDEFGQPELNDLTGHRFVGPLEDFKAVPYTIWLDDKVAPDAFALRANSDLVRRIAICHGVGIGFLDDQDAHLHRDLVEILPPNDDWKFDLWVVTHVDQHRTAKVQAFLDHIKKAPLGL